jgi:hypothetical protein
MNKVIFSLGIALIFFIGCSKSNHNSLVTSDVSIKNTRTGGNGNGTNEYTREYEIHEQNGTISCLTMGSDCMVKMIKHNNDNILELKSRIATNQVGSYFEGTSWVTLFPDLVNQNDIVDNLRNGNYYLLDLPTYDMTACFALSSSPNFNSAEVQRIWFFTDDNQSISSILCGNSVFDRDQNITDGGTKVDCSKAGYDCEVNKITKPNVTIELNNFEVFRESNSIIQYFNTQKWTDIFPTLNDEQLSLIKNGTLNILKMDYVQQSNTCYVLTNATSISNLTSDNLIRTWVFPN